MTRIATCSQANYLTLDRPVDGDTIRITVKLSVNTTDKLRLMEVDAPERGQAGYVSARNELLNWMNHNELMVELVFNPKRDRCTCNRLLGWLWAGDVLVNEALLASGWCKHLSRFGPTPYSPRMVKAQEKARQAHRGLW